MNAPKALIEGYPVKSRGWPLPEPRVFHTLHTWTLSIKLVFTFSYFLKADVEQMEERLYIFVDEATTVHTSHLRSSAGYGSRGRSSPCSCYGAQGEKGAP